jgi:16S rRNA (guanine966-N2)-methyltransferase
VRVIAGRLRGRPLRAPRGSATRPTSDRVRESLFALLGDLTGACVADLYAGSGALGIEALSRGAEHVVFVDAAGSAIQCIRDNVERLGIAQRATSVRSRVERAGGALLRSAPYALILCDPPWPELGPAQAALARLAWSELLSPGAIVVVEHPARRPLERLAGTGLALGQRRTWGDTAASFFTPSDPAPGHSPGDGPDGSHSAAPGV